MFSWLKSLSLAVMMLASACSFPAGASEAGAAIDSRGESEPVGAIAMRLALAGSEVLDVVRWTVTLPSGTDVRSGSLDVTNEKAVSLVVGDLPVVSGLRVALSGYTADGSVSCAGSASFDVEDGRTTQVPVLLACTAARAAPAMPLWASCALALGVLCSGSAAARRRRSRSSGIVSLAVAILATAPAGLTGCSSHDGAPSRNGSAESVGAVGIALALPDGASIDSVHWTITGPNGSPAIVQEGTVDVHDSAGLRIVVAGLAGESYYDVALTGATTDGSSTCTGAGSFVVSARTTANITVVLDCGRAAREAGAVAISAQTFSCAYLRSFSVSAAEANVGASVDLSASATGVDPAGLSYIWKAPSGIFSSPNSAATAFTCDQAGTVPITLRVSDGPIPDGGSCDEAASTLIFVVTCLPGDGGLS